MSTALTFWDRLRAEAVPTGPQTLGVVVLSLVVLIGVQSQAILTRLGISAATLANTQNQFHTRFDGILRSPVVSNFALITFWATLGLIAYLISWGVYSIFVEARNEVTLNTDYTNRGGHWRGPYQTLGLKAAAAIILTIILTAFAYTFSLWLALSSQIIGQLSVATSLEALAAVIGLSANFYLAFLFIQLTFTPWYRIQAFTEV